MKQTLLQWEERVNAMAPRERGLLLLVSIVVLLLAFDFILYRQAAENIEQGEQRLSAMDTEAAQTRQRLLALRTEAARDPDAPLRDQLARLTQRRDELDAQLSDQAGGLISPQQMRELLADLLQNTDELSLTGVGNRPPRPMIPPPEGEPPSAGTLYEHRLQLSFCGPYLATIDYLRGLEQLPWGLVWQEFSMQVDDGATPCYQLGVATFSFEEDAIGV